MPRLLSNRAVSAVMAQHTDEAFIMLVEFTHTPTDETFRAALNTENVVSNGEVYTATYFDITLPETANSSPKGAQIRMDNVDRRLIDLLRRITKPLSVTLRVVLAATPNVVEMEFTDLVLREADWDAATITGTLTSEDPLNQAFPSHLYEPRSFQGLF